eukprot:2368224-Pyramimonas_sp.AAC.1
MGRDSEANLLVRPRNQAKTPDIRNSRCRSHAAIFSNGRNARRQYFEYLSILLQRAGAVNSDG